MLTIREPEVEDLEALDPLLESRFGHPMGIAEWEWKYRRLPGEARSLVATDGAGELLAHVGALGLPARWQGGEALMWSLVDWVGRPNRAGLRPPLVEVGRRLLSQIPRPGDVPWNYGFPSRRHFELGRRVFGYREVRQIPRWAGALPQGRHDPRAAEPMERCGPWAEAAWEACGALGVRRSPRYLDWRYWARPERYYRVYRLREGDASGLAVAAFVGRQAILAELWLPPGRLWGRCLESVASDLRRSGIERWVAWPPAARSGGKALLRDLGMSPDGEPVLLGCRLVGADARVEEVAELTFTPGDHDIV
jgi:hypothetical protein